MTGASTAKDAEPRAAEQLRKRILQLFDDVEDAKSWWTQAHPALGLRKPEDLLSTKEGRERLDELILGVEHGEFV